MHNRPMPDKRLTAAEISQNRDILRFVRLWIIFRGTTQKRVAEELGVSQATVSKWLAGRQTISAAQFVTLCRLLSAAPEDVLSGPPLVENGRAVQWRRLADLTASLSSEQLDVLIAMGEQLARKN